jgi:hypothetical protein
MSAETANGLNEADQKWLNIVVQHVNSLRYGVVEIVVHDSRVIQIEKTERFRLEKTSQGSTERK